MVPESPQIVLGPQTIIFFNSFYFLKFFFFYLPVVCFEEKGIFKDNCELTVN